VNGWDGDLTQPKDTVKAKAPKFDSCRNGVGFLETEEQSGKTRLRIPAAMKIQMKGHVQGEEQDNGRGGDKDSERNESC
jgi:hypothetical protein